MKLPFKEEMFEKLESLDKISELNKIEITELINNLLRYFVSILSKFLKNKSIIQKRNIVFGYVKQDLGINYGLIRSKDKIIIADWILDLQSRTRNYLIFFLIIKESILHFYKNDVSEIDEVIINIITIQLLVEVFGIKTVDNPMLNIIRTRMFSEEIANLNPYFWDNLLLLLVRNKISFSEILAEYEEITNRVSISSSEIISLFSEWTFLKTIKEGDSILPIFANLKLIELIELLNELGHEKGTTSFIAKKLNLTQKTITKRFKALNESYSTYWRIDINYEKINLHNYLFKIKVKEKKHSEKLLQMLQNMPYLKSLFLGSDSESEILYSPTLVCPHIISDQLNEKLSKMKNSGIIKDYFLQIVRERTRRFTTMNYPFDSTNKTFNKLIKQSDSPLRKYIFYHYKRSSKLPTEEKPLNLDYNLLNFLSVINTKLLLKSRYGVFINEFKKFYLRNNILQTDVNAQTDLLYQNESRAKKRGLISFSLYMRNLLKRSTDVLIFEIPISNGITDKEFSAIIEKLQVFSLLGQNTLYDRHIFNLPGVAHTHPIKNVIQDFLEKEGLSPTFYTIKFYKSNFVPLHDLYDFEEQKWAITDFKE